MIKNENVQKKKEFLEIIIEMKGKKNTKEKEENK